MGAPILFSLTIWNILEGMSGFDNAKNMTFMMLYDCKCESDKINIQNIIDIEALDLYKKLIQID